jgi:hypothetical protein
LRPAHVHLSLPIGHFPSDLFTKVLYAFFISQTCYMFRPSHPKSIWQRIQFE